ncbi:hypothetical protein [Kaistella antarctica]|uniref:Uncharacterized protein n=1 Tax=Kaistella antarctica TaxID=266748 RepID=A0A448NM58_9FLAO|nr:hypothetical protein [Kaistella antarctica]KEY20177.1 hypothetical protein HY04_02915 [Kaistella antarctica]SEV92729.1 hypothetical protein SAMN05421765_1187 [Kaistella antarctica]VEH94984.1 Uncharacterised protein [Kaistella antarctica]
MKTSPFFILLFLLIFTTQINAQSSTVKDSFTLQLQEKKGDLNNDRIDDKIIVSIDTIDQRRSIQLQIFLSQPDGKLKRVVSTTQIIEAMYPNGGKNQTSEYQIPTFEIEEGIINMISEIKGGMASYSFKYQKGNFELIHISKSTWDGKNTTTETEYNLRTGNKIDVDKNLGSEKILNKREKKMPLKPLPKIQVLKHFDLQNY